MDDRVKCLNSWDVQCKHIVTPEGISESLCAGEKRWGSLPPNVCYETHKDASQHFYETASIFEENWVERYTVSRDCSAGNRAYIDICSTLRAQMGDNQPAVCYARQDVYAIENHPNDSRAKIDPDGIVQTLSSRMGTGGNNTPFVLIKNRNV